MQKWAAVDARGVVVHGFDADAEYASNFKQRVVDAENVETPSWYTETVQFVDVSAVDPRPVIGWYRDAAGVWIDGNPRLTSDKSSILPDGASQATVTYRQTGPNTPKSIVFNVNGQDVPETLDAQGRATLTLTSTNPGDVITVSANSAAVVVRVES